MKYLKLLNIIFEAYKNENEVHGCPCKKDDGCMACEPADLLRKVSKIKFA